jgi:NADH pyrophosphatase NudC (nudix superfamily)
VNVAITETYCGHCGQRTAQGDSPASATHQSCQQRLVLEPPRYCALCGRRMKVQVTPTGWTAQCTRHAVLVQ